MKTTTVLIYREWLQMLRYGSVSLTKDRLIAEPASKIAVVDLLDHTPEIDYRDKTGLIACEVDALLTVEPVSINIDNVIRWLPLSVSTHKDLSPEAERLKCKLDDCPWGNEYDEFVKQHHARKLAKVLDRWLASFQLDGDIDKANSFTVELPRIREITFPGKPFSGIYYAIDGHARNKPSDLKESVKTLKVEFQREQYKGFGGYPKPLEHASILIKSTDQEFSLLALALLYTYTSLEKGLLDFCTFHNDVIWLSEKTSAQEALNVASIVGRHHGPEYMTGIYCSSSNNAAFVQDEEVTAHLAMFQERQAKRNQQSTGPGEQNGGEAIDPPVDQSTDSSVEKCHDKTGVKTQQVANNDQTVCDSAGNDANDAVASDDVAKSANEQPGDQSVEQPEQPNSKSASESTDVAEALTEPSTKSMTDNDAAIATDHSDHGTKEANQNTDSMDGVVEAVATPKSEANADSDTAPTDDKPKDAIGDGDPSYQGDKHDTPSQEPDENYTSGTPETVPVSDLGEADGKLDESSDSGALELPRDPRSQAKSNRKGNNSVKRSQSGSSSQKSNDKTAGNSVSIETGLFRLPDDEAKVN